MLTREEAKTKECPIKRANTLVIYSKPLTQQQLGDLYEPTRCHAENCPKWHDAFIEYEGLKSHCAQHDCDKCGDLESYQKHCLNCEHHYGRCGG